MFDIVSRCCGSFGSQSCQKPVVVLFEPRYTACCCHAGFVIGVGLWVFWSLRRERLVVAEDADLTFLDMFTHSTVSAFAFALYTMSMGPHFALLQSQFDIPNVMPMLVMVVFPLVVGVLGDTYIKKVAAVAVTEAPHARVAAHVVDAPNKTD